MKSDLQSSVKPSYDCSLYRKQGKCSLIVKQMTYISVSRSQGRAQPNLQQNKYHSLSQSFPDSNRFQQVDETVIIHIIHLTMI